MGCASKWYKASIRLKLCNKRKTLTQSCNTVIVLLRIMKPFSQNGIFGNSVPTELGLPSAAQPNILPKIKNVVPLRQALELLRNR